MYNINADLRACGQRMLDAISMLRERSIGTPYTYFDEHPLSEEGIVRWRELNDAGQALRAALLSSAPVATSGKWTDGRLGEAFDLMDEVLRDHPSESGVAEAIRHAREAIETADMAIPQ